MSHYEKVTSLSSTTKNSSYIQLSIGPYILLCLIIYKQKDGSKPLFGAFRSVPLLTKKCYESQRGLHLDFS
jgi:hypothetical protein